MPKKVKLAFSHFAGPLEEATVNRSKLAELMNFYSDRTRLVNEPLLAALSEGYLASDALLRFFEDAKQRSIAADPPVEEVTMTTDEVKEMSSLVLRLAGIYVELSSYGISLETH